MWRARPELAWRRLFSPSGAEWLTLHQWAQRASPRPWWPGCHRWEGCYLIGRGQRQLMTQLLPADHALVEQFDPFLRLAAGKEEAQADPAAAAENAGIGA